MKSIRAFVCLSSLILAGWLGLTFVSKVPPQRYPTVGEVAATAGSDAGGDADRKLTVKVEPEAAVKEILAR